MIKMADEMDQLFNDIMSQCESEGRNFLSQFSDSVRDRLEKYERNVRKEIVSRKKNNHTPLFNACRSRKVEMVEYLISTCSADVEQRGFFGKYKMVLPLCVAASMYEKPIIECLVRHGAQVNAISHDGSTPVKAACDHWVFYESDKIMDVVKFLVEHRADIHRANDRGVTCLMAATGNVKLCEFLLKNGADINARAIDGRTALHYAIRKKELDTVRLLLNYGADVTIRSSWSGDALQTACVEQSQPIFDYLVKCGSYSPGRLADANELMGACCDNDEQTLEYWRRAIEIRNSNAVDGKPLAKTPFMPKRDCYRNASEFTTLDELDAIALYSDAFNMQKLLVYERVLGEDAGVTSNVIHRIATSYIESSRYKNGFDLWRRALEISTAFQVRPWEWISMFAGKFVYALRYLHERIPLEVADGNRDNEEQLQFTDVVAVFKLFTNRFVTVQPTSEQQLANLKDDNFGSWHYDKILESITHFICLLVKMARTDEAKDEVQALVRRLVNQNFKSTENHETLLHLCVSSNNTAILAYSDYNARIFPDLEVTRLLLKCKADVNARNEDGEAPLHIASHGQNFSNQIVKLLLDHGAHLDMPDKSGSTPAHLLSVNPDNTVNLANYMRLQCLAAQAAVQYEIPCNDLPDILNQFVDLHRPL